MEVVFASFQSPSVSSGAEYLEVSGRLSHDFGAKSRFDELDLENQIRSEVFDKLSDEFEGKMKLEDLELENQPRSEELEAKRGGEEEEEEEEEFSFVCLNPDGSPISADDAFNNGQIQPIFLLFNQDLLFADSEDGVSSSIDGATTLRPLLRKKMEGEGQRRKGSQLLMKEMELRGKNVISKSGRHVALTCLPPAQRLRDLLV